MGSPVQLCSVKGCYNFGRYCRLHSVQTFKPLVQPRRESDGAKEVLKEYRKEVKKFITIHPKCQVKDCNHVSECVHHKIGRIGDNLMNKKHWLAVCLDHHRQIEDNPDWAKENGYSSSRLKENDAAVSNRL